MQVLQAGPYKFIFLELDPTTALNVAAKAGFEGQVEDFKRNIVLHLRLKDRQSRLLLFDAADQANSGWFLRCQFYVDGRTGQVLQTPLRISNRYNEKGEVDPYGIDVQIAKELPASFRFPGQQPVTEQMVYAVLFNFLTALQTTGVGICGVQIVQPVVGRINNGTAATK